MCMTERKGGRGEGNGGDKTAEGGREGERELEENKGCHAELYSMVALRFYKSVVAPGAPLLPTPMP